jgi:hypothetical protein
MKQSKDTRFGSQPYINYLDNKLLEVRDRCGKIAAAGVLGQNFYVYLVLLQQVATPDRPMSQWQCSEPGPMW